MCGFAGLVLSGHSSHSSLRTAAASMGKAVSHRGPDNSGLWVSSELQLALSHQRLAVQDLSPAGDQPMHSMSGRYVIAFNGEIYNQADLRRQLADTGLSISWRGHSDTELLLAAIEVWGLEAALQRCVGMWALALIDRQQRCLYLARDRFGEKPLYWGFTGSGQHRALVFGSELSALRAYHGFDSHIDRAALAEFLRFGHVPAPLSIFEGISKLSPGHFISLELPFSPLASSQQSRPWWQLCNLINYAYGNQFSSEELALESLESTLTNAVLDQSISDVPLGAFLSGGIDSSLISALLQRNSSRPISTFTVGFEESNFNEAPYAAAVAAHLGTHHTQLYFTNAEAHKIIPEICQVYSEPFADSSQLPTYLVCREARQCGLTVALSGDGGDELFGGYNRYLTVPQIWATFSKLPYSIRLRLGNLLTRIPPGNLDALGTPFSYPHLGHKLHKLASRL